MHQHSPTPPQQNNRHGPTSPPSFFKGGLRRRLAILLFLAGVGLAGYGSLRSRPPAPPAHPTLPESSQESAPTLEEAIIPPLPEPVITQPELVGKLFTTQERLDYRSGQMTLQIPRLGVDVAVQQSTEDQDLAVGVGLFAYAQLPGEGNRNVSIAGHRDIKGCEFYYIDRLTPGDLLYLTYNNQVYIYQYKSTAIIAPDNWGPITSQGYSCITLLSCWPLGSTRERIVVVGQLVDTVPWTEHYVYAPTTGIQKLPPWDDEAPTFDQWPQASSSVQGSSPAPAPVFPPQELPGAPADSPLP